MIKFKLDDSIRNKKVEEILDLPTLVKVTEFNAASVKDFASEFAKATQNTQKVVPVVIDSYGGEVYSLLAMIDIIQSSKKPVATVCLGKAMSCGAVLLACGSQGMRYAAPNSTIMIHDVSSMGRGKVGEVTASAGETERLNKIIYHTMAENCGKSKNYFLDIVHSKGHADWFLNAKTGVSHGIVNLIGIPAFDVDVRVDINFGIIK